MESRYGVITAGALLATLAVAVTVPGLGAEAGPAPNDTALAAGPWLGVGSANAGGRIRSKGLRIDWRVDVPADFDFEIDRDGKAAGTWSYRGHATNVLKGRFGGRRGTGVAEFEISGRGKVRGNATRLRLTGSGRQVGDMVISSGGRSVTFDASQKSKVPTLRMPVIATTCNEAYGEWAYAIEQGLREQGFSASANGDWMAFRDTERARQEGQSLLEGARVDRGDDASTPLLRSAAALMQRYAAMRQSGPAIALDQLAELFKETEAVLNSFRNLSACDEALLGEGLIARYMNGLTFILVDIIGSPSVTESPEVLRALGLGALRSGLIGPGALDQGSAEVIENELAALTEAVLNQALEEGWFAEVSTDGGGSDGDGLGIIDLLTGALSVSLTGGETSQISEGQARDLAEDIISAANGSEGESSVVDIAKTIGTAGAMGWHVDTPSGTISPGAAAKIASQLLSP